VMQDAARESRKKAASEDADYHSTRISESARVIGFGLLAAYYGIKIAPDALIEDGWLLSIVGVAGVATVLLDYLHYWFGYRLARTAEANAEYVYNEGWGPLWYGCKVLAFRSKQASAFAGACALLILVWCS